MPGFRARFTLRRMMVVVSLVAVGLAAIRVAVASWGAKEIVLLTVTIFLSSHVLALIQKSRWQSFWIGFGLCGWAYLTLALASPLAGSLPTDALLRALDERVRAYKPVSEEFPGIDPYLLTAVSRERRWAFRRRGQGAFSLIFATLGGLAAIVLIPTTGEDESIPRPPDGPPPDRGRRDEEIIP